MCFAVVCCKVGMNYVDGGGFCCLSFLGCVRGVFGSGVFVSGEEGVPEGCVLGDEWGRMMTDMYNGEVRSSF